MASDIETSIFIFIYLFKHENDCYQMKWNWIDSETHISRRRHTHTISICPSLHARTLMWPLTEGTYCPQSLVLSPLSISSSSRYFAATIAPFTKTFALFLFVERSQCGVYLQNGFQLWLRPRWSCCPTIALTLTIERYNARLWYGHRFPT